MGYHVAIKITYAFNVQWFGFWLRYGFPGGASSKESACQCRGWGFDPWVRKIPWKRDWQPTPVFLPGESHGQRSLAGYSPWDLKELDTTEHVGLKHGDTASFNTVSAIYLAASIRLSKMYGSLTGNTPLVIPEENLKCIWKYTDQEVNTMFIIVRK